MEGVNYQFMCHHPDDMIQDLLADTADFMGEQKHLNLSLDSVDQVDVRSCDSPRGVDSSIHTYEKPDDMFENVMDAVNQTLVFCDAPFICSPESIAYAIICIETGSFHPGGHMGDDMQSYLITRYPFKSEDEILDFSRQVGRAIACLLECKDLDLVPGKSRPGPVIAQRAEELRRVLVQVADLRLLYQLDRYGGCAHSRKWKRRRQYDYCPRYRPTAATAATGKQPAANHRKMAKITPTNTGYVY